jgi:hypothetical protein
MFVFENRALLEELGELLLWDGGEVSRGVGGIGRFSNASWLAFADAMLCLRRLSITGMPIWRNG